MRCDRPVRLIPSCRSWRFAVRTAASKRSCSTTPPTPSGPIKPGVRSPSFYGLAAQALEKEKGGTFLFFEGASGSTHNLDVLAPEATLRIQQAVERALADGPTPIGRQSGRTAERDHGQGPSL